MLHFCCCVVVERVGSYISLVVVVVVVVAAVVVVVVAAAAAAVVAVGFPGLRYYTPGNIYIVLSTCAIYSKKLVYFTWISNI